MKRLFTALAIVACLVFRSTSAFAGIDSWVSSTGSDASSLCLRSAPCATFTKAFSQTSTGSVIHVLDSGAYGTLTITKSVTIDGGGIGTTLGSDGDSISNIPQFVINAGSADVVTLQNFTMSGGHFSSDAISVSNVGALHVQNCVFVAFATAAVSFQAANGLLDMKNVTIMDMPTGTGVYVANARASLDDVSLNHLQTGVLAAGSSTVSIRHSTANGNGTAFAAAFGPTAQLNVDDCMMTNNQWAVVVSQGAKAYVGRSSFFNNGITALFNDGMSFAISYGTNQFAGNASDGTFTAGMALK